MDTLFLYGSEVELNDSIECINFIKTQSVTETVAKNSHYNLKLVFNDGFLSYVGSNADEGSLEFDMREAEGDEKSCPLVDAPAHYPYHIVASNDASSYLGGKPPEEFSMDELDGPVPFQFFGKLTKEDYPNFVMPFDLYLCAPIFAANATTYVDYSTPGKPRFHDPKTRDTLKLAYGEINSDFNIHYEKQGVAFRKANNTHNSGFVEYEDGEFEYVQLFDEEPPQLGHTGVPAWFQYPEIPTIPNTGNVLKFVCEIDPAHRLKTAFHNLETDDQVMLEYFDHLHFWQDGTLKVFLDPESALVCYYMSST